MADFNWREPGGREYLIVGGAALGLGLLYFWWKSRKGQTGQTGQQQPAAGTPQAAQPVVIAQGNGIPPDALKSFLLDNQSSPTPAPTPVPAQRGNYTGPNVRGMTLGQATQTLQAAGYRVTSVSSGGASVDPAANQNRVVYSFTPYSSGSVRVGLQ